MKNFIIFTLSLILLVSCKDGSTNSTSSMSRFAIEADANNTDFEKKQINRFNYGLQYADTLIVAYDSNDKYAMARAMEEMRDNCSSAYKNLSKTPLKSTLKSQWEIISDELDNLGIPREVTYKMPIDDRKITVRQGHIWSPLLEYDKIFISEDGTLCRTVRRDFDNISVQTPTNGQHCTIDGQDYVIGTPRERLTTPQTPPHVEF